MTSPSTPLSDFDQMAVDIIINNHDYGRFVAAAVESALAQTHPRVRVIVVDDGSTDDSRAILSGYTAEIDLIMKENGGQASALNTGFEASHGDVVIFLDADDMLCPQAASLVARAFSANPRLAKVQYRMEVIDGSGKRMGVLKPAPHLPLPRGDFAKAELTFPFDLTWMATSANAFDAGALRRILPMPEQEFARCADWYLVHLTPLLGEVDSVDQVAALYRVHGENRFEPQDAKLNLEHVRDVIDFSAATAAEIERLAGDLALIRPHRRILSIADLAHRLVSLKLEPRRHPIADDRISALVTGAARAAVRRFDVAWPMKLLYVAWFASTAIAPKPLARRLAESFFFPQRRQHINRALRGLHRWNRRMEETDGVRG